MLGDQFILLSFDDEKCDAPLKYGHSMMPKEQLTVGHEGLKSMRQPLEIHSIPTTLFTTAYFASHFTNTIFELSYDHEIASHTFYHSFFRSAHLIESRIILESITVDPVTGVRMPAVHYLDSKLIADAGYKYDWSLHPTFSQRNHQRWTKSHTVFCPKRLLRIPASVTPLLRIPLFSVSFKNLPYSLYLKLLRRTIKSTGYVCLYFHSWEFFDLQQYVLPKYVKKSSGDLAIDLS